MQDLTVAVVGATGAVGAEFLRIVEKRYSTPPRLKLLASSRSAGKRLPVSGTEYVVEEATPDSFQDVDIAFISASGDVSRALGPAAVAAGAVVIDDSSAFRMEPEVPLVVPEVNGADVEWHQGTISIPNCSTTPLVMVAHPLRQVSPIVRGYSRHLPVGIRSGGQPDGRPEGTVRAIEGPRFPRVRQRAGPDRL